MYFLGHLSIWKLFFHWPNWSKINFEPPLRLLSFQCLNGWVWKDPMVPIISSNTSVALTTFQTLAVPDPGFPRWEVPTPKWGMPTYYYHPQQSWGKVIFSQASVILLTGYLVPGVFALGVPGPGDAWSRGACSVGRGGLLPGDLLPGDVPGGNPPGRPLLWAVRILMKCILIW